MIWHDASIILTFAFSSIMGLLFLRLYLTNEKPESLLIWAAAWGAYCTSVILLISGIEHVNLAPVFLPASEIFAMINCALLLYEIHSYYRKRMNPERIKKRTVPQKEIQAGFLERFRAVSGIR